MAGFGLWQTASRPATNVAPIGLFTSLPILWSEQADLARIVDDDSPPHWARGEIERLGRPVALDTLLDLGSIDRLIVAQPRALAPDENVALDQWVRQGGKVLLIADPMLTQESAFPLGDRRRPQDIVMLSPIFGRWGLTLHFDEAQQAGEHLAEREIAGASLPVNLPGHFTPGGRGHEARCAISPSGLLARCRIGKGHALLLADAALLEPDDAQGKRSKAFAALLDEAFLQ